MNNVRTVSLNSACCFAAWLTCSILICAALFAAFAGHPSGLAWALALSNFGLLAGMIGGVLMVRGYFIRDAQRDRSLLDLARTLERDRQQQERPLHRV